MGPKPPASLFDDFALPAASKLLGWTLRNVDVGKGTIEIGFTADDRFVNPAGNVQGGFLAAMLDDTQGPALLAMTNGAVYAPTIDFTISFIKPARPGHFVGKGRVVSRGKTIIFTEAELFDEAGDLVARASFTARAMSGDMARAPR
ncbi:MAG TPA: PaaI family thioesterase [Sphingomicrobium sp.]|nr:PaaI family thioesterase [Sphingomicrobium sp.]